MFCPFSRAALASSRGLISPPDTLKTGAESHTPACAIGSLKIPSVGILEGTASGGRQISPLPLSVVRSAVLFSAPTRGAGFTAFMFVS